jgi:phosphoglycerol transferase MdoB-like AlkP superfamily enzyme
MQDIPGYKKLEKHSMGLHDEYVLNFMQGKMQEMEEPFFVTQYNVSTHYPNDLPTAFAKRMNGEQLSPAMKSMIYYDECLQQFFKSARAQHWYNNTVFVFVSDHWATPADPNITPHLLNSFRIPVIVFDPSVNQKEQVDNNISQLDIMNGILAYAGDEHPFTSYGESLTASLKNRTVFTKTNNAVYQAINDHLVLGFDAELGRSVYGYDYKKDPGLQMDLLKTAPAYFIQIEKEMKAFLQTAVQHYQAGKQKNSRK